MTRVRCRINPYGVYGERSGIGTGFYSSASGSRFSIITPTLRTHLDGTVIKEQTGEAKKFSNKSALFPKSGTSREK